MRVLGRQGQPRHPDAVVHVEWKLGQRVTAAGHPDPCASGSSGACAHATQVDLCLGRLQRLGWHRVDVSFAGERPWVRGGGPHKRIQGRGATTPGGGEGARVAGGGRQGEGAVCGE